MALPSERHAHRGPRAAGHALAHPEPAEQPGHERAQALDDQHVRHRGAVERHDEAGGRDGEAGRHRRGRASPMPRKTPGVRRPSRSAVTATRKAAQKIPRQNTVVHGSVSTRRAIRPPVLQHIAAAATRRRPLRAASLLIGPAPRRRPRRARPRRRPAAAQPALLEPHAADDGGEHDGHLARRHHVAGLGELEGEEDEQVAGGAHQGGDRDRPAVDAPFPAHHVRPGQRQRGEQDAGAQLDEPDVGERVQARDPRLVEQGVRRDQHAGRRAPSRCPRRGRPPGSTRRAASAGRRCRSPRGSPRACRAGRGARPRAERGHRHQGHPEPRAIGYTSEKSPVA